MAYNVLIVGNGY